MKRFHKIFYGFLRGLIVIWFTLTRSCKWKVYHPKSSNYLVLTNHNTNIDFFLIGLAFRRHMYFVASEHIMRLGFTSKLIRFLADPIARTKGASADKTVSEIKRRLAEGSNVCMMVEGNRSFFGNTCWISPANGPLVKSCGAGLITYKLHGGYFANPRWSREKRHGPVWGEVVHEYTPEEISAMSEEEITAAIRSDLSLNAYDDQAEKPHRYTCRKPAETLETALFTCPCCHSFSSMRSSGNRFYCSSCKTEALLDDYGYFQPAEGGEPPFQTIFDWSQWQQSYLESYLRSDLDLYTPIFSDENLMLFSIEPGKKKAPVGTGTLSLYSDRLVFRSEDQDYIFPVSQIKRTAVALVDTFLFTSESGYYEVKDTGVPYSAIKYLMAWRFLTGREYR